MWLWETGCSTSTKAHSWLGWAIGMAYLALGPWTEWTKSSRRSSQRRKGVPAFILRNCDFTAVASSAVFIFSCCPIRVRANLCHQSRALGKSTGVGSCSVHGGVPQESPYHVSLSLSFFASNSCAGRKGVQVLWFTSCRRDLPKCNMS